MTIFLSYCPHSQILPFRRIPEILRKVLSIWLDMYLNIFQLCLTPAFVLQLLALISLISFPKPHLGLIEPVTHVQSLQFSVCPLIVWQLWSKNQSTSSLQFYSSPPNSWSSTKGNTPRVTAERCPWQSFRATNKAFFCIPLPRKAPALPAV